MVSDYVQQLYTPAARAGRALGGTGHHGARQLAGWKAKVRSGWSDVRVDHVESSGVSDSPQVGDVLSVRAFVSLDGLAPDDVQVEVVHGRVTPSDELGDTQVVALRHAPLAVVVFDVKRIVAGPGAAHGRQTIGLP